MNANRGLRQTGLWVGTLIIAVVVSGCQKDSDGEPFFTPPKPPKEKVSPGSPPPQVERPEASPAPSPAPDGSKIEKNGDPSSLANAVNRPDNSQIAGVGAVNTPTEIAFPENLLEEGRRLPWTEEYSQVLEAVWKSELGELFNEYLFSEDPNQFHSTEPVVARVFAADNTLMPLSALQLMVEDLQVRDHLDTQQIQRLIVLWGDLQRKEQELIDYPGKGVALPAIVSFIAILPLGFPHIRRAILTRVVQWIDKIPLVARPTGAQKFLLNRITKTGDATKFQIGYVVGTYFKYIGPIELVYIMWFDFEEQKKDHSIDEKVENLKESPEFDDFVAELALL